MDKQEKQTKEQLILAAAEHEFLTKGYDCARTTSIAQAAGVTHAMLHYYFRTKEQLFERIVDEKYKLMSHSMLTVMGEPTLPVIERIRSGISAHFDFMADNSKLPLFIINEIMSRPERYEMLRSRISSIIENLFSDLQHDIDRAAKRGEMAQVDARLLMMSIISLNIFTFVAYPLIQPLMGDLVADRERFLAVRKAENIETIMCRIKAKQ